MRFQLVRLVHPKGTIFRLKLRTKFTLNSAFCFALKQNSLNSNMCLRALICIAIARWWYISNLFYAYEKYIHTRRYLAYIP